LAKAAGHGYSPSLPVTAPILDSTSFNVSAGRQLNLAPGNSLKANYLKRSIVAIATLVVALIALFAVGVLWPTRSLEPVRTTTPLAIVNVTVVDVQGARLVSSQTVLVEVGRIVAVGDAAAVDVPSTAQIVDGGNRYLLPALWDMHAHVYAFSPLLDLPLFIAYGVTNVRDMQGCPQPDDPFIACAKDKRRWTAEALAGERIGPRIVASPSFMANGPGILERMTDVPEFFGTATSGQGREFVRYFAGQVDAIKVYDHIPRDAYFELADEAHRLNMDVVGHRPHAVSAIEAAQRQKSIEHARFLLHESFTGSAELRRQAGSARWREDRRRMLDEHDPQMVQAIFAAMKRNGTWYVPTHLTRWVDAYADDPTVREDPLLRYLHPLMKRQWLEDIDETLADDPSPAARETYRAFYRKGLELTHAAHQAGVRILVGTDYIVAGADVHRELEQLVLAGLTPAEALRAATLAPAEYFGLEAQYGAVAAGQVADLLLLGADPLVDIRNTQHIEAVIFNGNLYDRNALDRISLHVERQARSWSAACKILWRFIRNPVGY
jgi:imidazolonepropionase-like amidohydrolase